MKNLVFALLTAAVLLPAAPAAGGRSSTVIDSGNEAERVLLKETVTVNSRRVYIGDLFSSAGNKADIAIAYAPKPGKRAIFDARWLYRVARAYNLDWRPLSNQDQVVVERKSQVITREEIEDHIRAALIERGADQNTTVELSNRMMRLYVAGDADITISVEDVIYEPRTKRFTAILLAPAGTPGATRTRVTGRVNKTVEVPVVERPMMPNEVITKNDIKWIRVRGDRLPKDAITDIDELIGKAAKRRLRAGVPVRRAAVQRPILVPKGSLVTIILKAPRMTLTARGKALDNGTKGDTVRVRVTNLQSKKVIEAEVTGTARVAVFPPGRLAIN